jgi:hypothetical protein
MPVVDKINQEGTKLFGLIDGWVFEIGACQVIICTGRRKEVFHIENVRMATELTPLIKAIYNCVIKYLEFRETDIKKRPWDYGIIEEETETL